MLEGEKITLVGRKLFNRAIWVAKPQHSEMAVGCEPNFADDVAPPLRCRGSLIYGADQIMDVFIVHNVTMSFR